MSTPRWSQAHAALYAGLPSATPRSLDLMDRTIALLAGHGFFERWSLVGAWVVDSRRFCLVLRAMDDHGLLVGWIGPATPSDDDLPAASASEAAAAELDQMRPQEAAGWAARGWTAAGIAFNRDPTDLPLPWGPDGPPALDPTLHAPWFLSPADSFASPDIARAFRSLGATWSETAALNLAIMPPTWMAPDYRLVAVWTIRPDAVMHVVAIIRDLDQADLDSDSYDRESLAQALGPGQRYVRHGQFIWVSPDPRDPDSIERLETVWIQDIAEGTINAFPRNLLRRSTVTDHHFIWGRTVTPDTIPPAPFTAALAHGDCLENGGWGWPDPRGDGCGDHDRCHRVG